MLNIVIPMAGRGSRFAKEGYTLPKPLIPVLGTPMIEVVINNLRPSQPHRFIFLCLKEHIETYKIDEFLHNLEPNSIIVPVTEVTEGAACTVLLAKEFINNDDELMTANCDQWIDINIDDYLDNSNKYDGCIMTMFADDIKWSYAKLDENNFVIETAEKVVISEYATVGIYNFSKGSDFVKYAEEMIQKNIRVNNEFYIAPIYNQMASDLKKVTIYNIGGELDGLYGLGIPSDLQKFEKLDVAKKAVKKE